MVDYKIIIFLGRPLLSSPLLHPYMFTLAIPHTYVCGWGEGFLSTTHEQGISFRFWTAGFLEVYVCMYVCMLYVCKWESKMTMEMRSNATAGKRQAPVLPMYAF